MKSRTNRWLLTALGIVVIGVAAGRVLGRARRCAIADGAATAVTADSPATEPEPQPVS